VSLRSDESELPGLVERPAVADWAPGETVTVQAVFEAPPTGSYAVALTIPDVDRPEQLDYAVRIASRRGGEPLFDPATGANDLGLTVDVGP
jgi:hypothetical protein